jgi:hypothetical protein
MNKYEKQAKTILKNIKLPTPEERLEYLVGKWNDLEYSQITMDLWNTMINIKREIDYIITVHGFTNYPVLKQYDTENILNVLNLKNK